MRGVDRRTGSKIARIGTMLVLAGAFAACATMPPEHAMQRGLDDLAKRDYERALDRFETAARAPGAEADSLFFQGASLNRLGRYDVAFERLTRAEKRGVAHPDLGFETGWSLIGLHRWDDAATRLEQYERDHPGRAKTSELLGRAYLGTRAYDRAEVKFREAMQRDTTLRPASLFYLALIEGARSNPAAARVHLETLRKEAPHSPFARLLPP